MPEVTGTISDPARKRYYILKAAGSPAAEIFAFYARNTYEPKDIIHLDLIPVIMGSTESGSSNDAKAGVYITGDLRLQDVLCENGDRTCLRTKRKYVKQATLEPQDNNLITITGYLRNGEMLTSPPKDPKPSESLIYAISPILIGQPDDLATPLGLALLKERLKEALNVPSSSGQEVGGSSQPAITFEPASSDDSGQALSSDGTSSNTSLIITGNQAGPSTSADRILCGEQVERSLNRALASNLDSNFTPWMTSTGSTPPSQRPQSAQSLPTDLEGSNSSEGSPQRPRSTSPIKGRKRARKNHDKSYRQPSIRNFLEPSSPASPRPRNLPAPRPRRRSHRHPPQPQPAMKRSALEASLDSTQELRTGSSTTASNMSDERILLDDPAILEAAGMTSTTSQNTSVEYLGEVLRPALREPDMIIEIGDDNAEQPTGQKDTPPLSASSSRAQSVNRAHNPEDDPTPGPSQEGVNESTITLHTNLPIIKKPHHVFVKAINKQLTVGFITFPVYNLAEIVRAFFEEQIEHDNPDLEAGFDVSALSELITPDGTLDSNNASLVSSTTQNFTATNIQTFLKEEVPSFSTVSDDQQDNQTINIDVTLPQMSDDEIVQRQHQEMMIQRDMSLIIEDVRTAGDSTLEQFTDTSEEDKMTGPTTVDDGTDTKMEEKKEDEENEEEGQ